jgi:hypothetical protein
MAELTPYNTEVLALLPIMFWVGAFILLARYYYLFLSKHTRLLLRTFYYICRKRGSDSGNKC